MAIIKNFTNNKWQRGCGEKGTLPHCWWESKLVQSLWRIVLRFLKKLKIELLDDSAVPLQGKCLEKTKIQKVICASLFTEALQAVVKMWKQPKYPASLFTEALQTVVKMWKQPKYPSTEDWIKKMWYSYSALKMYMITPSAARIHLEIVTLSEITPRKTNT